MSARLIVVAALSTFVATIAASASNDRALPLLKQWVAAVDEHTPGEHDAALDRISTWGYDDLELMQGYVAALAEVPRNTSARERRRSRLDQVEVVQIRAMTKDLQLRGDFDRFRKRAALLHTDAAIFGSSALRVPKPPPPGTRARDQYTRRMDVLSRDGEIERFQLANPHWDYARDLLEALPRKPRLDPIVAEWYRAIAAHFMLHRSFAEALDHFDNARAIVPDEPDVLYSEACLQEVFGAPRIQDYVRIVTLQGVLIRGVSSPRSHFQKAAEMLRKALAVEPHFVDARLRLGRLLVELKIYDEALTHLAEVVASTKDPSLLYYAHIFSGDAAIAMQRPSDARGEYERAVDLYPRAQAAHLGLAAALRLMGERSGAVDAVNATITLPVDSRDEADEPWWNYYDGDAAVVDRLLTELRAPYREARK